MTELVYKSDSLNEVRLDDFELPVFEKVVDRRGYLYIVEDSAYPDFIKIGRTNDLKKRLMAYNGDKPYNSARYTSVSVAFKDVVLAEAKVLEKIYEEVPPTTFKKEWFNITDKAILLKWLKVCEAEMEWLDVPHS